MMNLPAPSVVDAYKLGHVSQFVKGTQYIGSNATPRDNRYSGVPKEYNDDKMIFFGISFIAQYMQDMWLTTFFDRPKREVIRAYKRRIKNLVGSSNGDQQVEAMAELHDLGYLPLHIKALPEGSRVNMGIPVFTITNTDANFPWLVNYMETFLSAMLWPMCHAACVGDTYRKIADRNGKLTGADDSWFGIAIHLFAARGHRGIEDSCISGMGHLLSNFGTDTTWSIDAFEKYYIADSDKELVGCSVNAIEHEHAQATQRIAYFGSEKASLEDLITNVYPTGIYSYVADSNDYFYTIDTIARELKDTILARQPDADGLPGKLVFRPDSSPKTPLEIICGDFDKTFKTIEDALCHYEDAHINEAREACEGSHCMGDDMYEDTFECDGKFYVACTGGFEYNRHDKQYYYVEEHDEITYKEIEATLEMRGSLNILWDIFGGTINAEGYRVLDSHVGLIYGEAISTALADKIFKRMREMGFCASNVLFGVGSWGYIGGSSRDSYGIAIKGTNSVVDGVEVSMQKDPKTASFSKKSAKGRLRVERLDTGDFVLFQEQTVEQEAQGWLKTVSLNGVVTKVSLQGIRDRLTATR